MDQSYFVDFTRGFANYKHTYNIRFHEAHNSKGVLFQESGPVASMRTMGCTRAAAQGLGQGLRYMYVHICMSMYQIFYLIKYICIYIYIYYIYNRPLALTSIGWVLHYMCICSLPAPYL